MPQQTEQPEQNGLPAVLTVEEAARWLRIGRSACYQAVRDGTISPTIRFGRSIRIPRAALLKMLGEDDE